MQLHSLADCGRLRAAGAFEHSELPPPRVHADTSALAPDEAARRIASVR